MRKFLVRGCIIGILAGILSSSSSQIITGKVVDKRTKPIANATVSLKVKGNSTKTDAEGKFSLNATGVITASKHYLSQRIVIRGKSVVFYTSTDQNVSVMLFTSSGKRIGRTFTQNFPEGTYSIDLGNIVSPKELSNSIYVLKIVIGKKTFSIPLSPLSIFNYGSKEVLTTSVTNAEKLATPDTLIVSKEGYITFTKALDSDIAQDVGTIQLNLVNDPDAIVEKKVDSLLALMTIEEKIAQTVQMMVDTLSPQKLKEYAFGSIFNGGVPPHESKNWLEGGKDLWSNEIDKFHNAALESRLRIPIIYGIDAVHGVALISGATIFPHNIGLGCTGDTALVAKAAHITAKECRAVGINLSFSPAISVARDERWGRTYEGFGETSEINSLMGAAYVRGLQGYGDLSAPYAVAACAKHFLGDGGTTGGVNIGVVELSEETIKALHLPPYEAVVKEGVCAIMPSFTSWKRNGVEIKSTIDKYLLTDMLKKGLNWDGFCSSDWDAIPQAFESERYTYKKEYIEKAVNAGLDMAMISMYHPTSGFSLQHAIDYLNNYKTLLNEGAISIERLNDAVKRILRVKFRMKLFENPRSNASLRAEFGSAEHRKVARECVRKSLVLLKNEGNVLPLKRGEKIVVVGKWGNSLGAQCGGWTISWQGYIDNTAIVGTTIFKGLQEVGGANVTYDENGNNLSGADKIVLVLGEVPYSEGWGDHGSKSSSFSNLYKNGKISIHLSECPNYDLLAKCVATNKPVILILISGRPLIIKEEDLNKIKALVAAWLPGSEGGGVADVLYGDYNFTGKLTHTWPRTFEQIPINTGPQYADEKKGSGGTPLFEYGFGLKY